MTDETNTSPAPAGQTPAGWNTDPTGRFQLRYWDGAAWTDHVSTNGVQQTDPVAGGAPVTPVVPTTPAPPVMVSVPRPKVVWPTRTKVVVLGGAALLLLGSVLSWAKVEAHFAGQTFSETTNGLEGDGKITLVLALVAGLVFLFVPRAKVAGSLVLAAGIIAGLVAIVDIADVNNKADDIREITSNADATVGIGLWIVAVAAIVLFVGGLLCLLQKDETTPAPPAA